ncbi:uncharacterized protein VTP21DRAFT_6401 [Calcarisporiella thermophila]|uniref:uncharacterized protein n=1 Tax=Calcarisporiella thermophila TaxID=911321 RepID=UPI0037420B55
MKGLKGVLLWNKDRKEKQKLASHTSQSRSPPKSSGLPNASELSHPSIIVNDNSSITDLPIASRSTNTEMPRNSAFSLLKNTPIDSLPIISRTPRRQHSSRSYSDSGKIRLERLPGFNEVSPGERQDLLLKKLRQCSAVFDFNDMSSDLEGKEIKRQALSEVLEHISQRGVISEPVYPGIITMFSSNLFRSISTPNNNANDAYDLEEDEPILDLSWPHLQMVYEIFLRFIESPDFNVTIGKKLIDQKFILQVLELFDSEDPRERDYLKTTLHRLYGKFLNHRAFIRRSINNIFFQLIYEKERHNGIAELLEILGSIINGFALPLREEHKVFLIRALVPLHKVRCLGLYHPQLTYCIVQFLDKDPSLTQAVFHGLLRYWPKTNSAKEVMFLHEIEEILDSMDPAEFAQIQAPLFRRIALCISSPHFQVAEQALLYWSNDYIVNLITANATTILPIVFPALYQKSKGHWNRNVLNLIHSALKVFDSVCPALLEECREKCRENEIMEETKFNERKQLWEKLEQKAMQYTSLSPSSSTPMAEDSADQDETKQGENGEQVLSDLLDCTDSELHISSVPSDAMVLDELPAQPQRLEEVLIDRIAHN